MGTFRILSIDDGGVRSALTAVLLQRLADEVPGFLEQTAFFAGTSTGSLLALGLAYDIPPAELVELMRAYGQQVVGKTLLNQVGQVVGARHEILDLQKLLTPYFGAAILQDFLARRGRFVLVPAFDLDAVVDDVRTWKPKFFHNFPGDNPDDGELAVDVILRSSAVPVHFPSYQGYISGSVVAGNPSVSALAQALQSGPDEQSLENIRLFSIGSGYFPRYIGGRQHNWGLARWSWALTSLLLDNDMGVSHYQCVGLLGSERYHRLAPILEEPVKLDDAEKIPDLIAFADTIDLSETVAWLNNYYLAAPSETIPGSTTGENEGAPDPITIDTQDSG